MHIYTVTRLNLVTIADVVIVHNCYTFCGDLPLRGRLSPHRDEPVEGGQPERLARAHRSADLPEVVEVDGDGAHGGGGRQDGAARRQQRRQHRPARPEGEVVPRQDGRRAVRLPRQHLHLAADGRTTARRR